MDAFDRLPDLLKHRGWNQTDASRELDCSQSMISLLLKRSRVPGRALANAIERASFTMPGGPIRSSDWDLVQAAREPNRHNDRDPSNEAA
jgi:transcriptional regulator with XRE-family HTH domain